jgi:hypothetical protein
MVENVLVTSGPNLTRPPRLSAPARAAARRFAEVVCPPGMLAHHRTDRVLAEFEQMLGALAPAARKSLAAGLVALDQGARLYPRSRGRRFTRLDDQAAEAYIRALLSRGVTAELVQRIKGLVVMCYYELPVVQREIGYDPAPYIAAVSRRRLESYGPQIRAGEAAVTGPATDAGPEQPDAASGQPGTGQPGTGQRGTGQRGTGQRGTGQRGTGQPDAGQR